MLAVVIAVALSACTVLFPTVGVLRGHSGADIFVDDHGCEVDENGSTRQPCTHPGPVDDTRTIAENALVGLLIDGVLAALIVPVVQHINDNTGN